MRFFISSPSVCMLKPATVPPPSVGKLSPQSIRMAVVFPAPFAPKKPKISPGYTSKLIWFTAANEPNFLVNLSTDIIGLIFALD